MDEGHFPPDDRSKSPLKRDVPPAIATGGVVLVVDLSADASDPPDIAENAKLVRAQLIDLDAALLASVRPDTVIGPLIGRDCDALTLIARLRMLDFRGRMVVLSPVLPNRAMVERELRLAAGPLSIDLIERS